MSSLKGKDWPDPDSRQRLMTFLGIAMVKHSKNFWYFYVIWWQLFGSMIALSRKLQNPKLEMILRPHPTLF